MVVILFYFTVDLVILADKTFFTRFLLQYTLLALPTLRTVKCSSHHKGVYELYPATKVWYYAGYLIFIWIAMFRCVICAFLFLFFFPVVKIPMGWCGRELQQRGPSARNMT